jgi:hypothetical protein
MCFDKDIVLGFYDDTKRYKLWKQNHDSFVAIKMFPLLNQSDKKKSS